MSKRNKQRAEYGDEDWNNDHHPLDHQGSNASGTRRGIDNEWVNSDAQNFSRQGITSLPELNLGEYTQAAKDTIDSMPKAHDAANNLSQQYLRHIADIQEISMIRSAYTALGEQVKFKDIKIKEQKITIRTLKGETRDQEDKLAADAQRISDDRAKLEREIEKVARDKEIAAKRHIMQQAEGKNRLEKELQKLKLEHEQILKDRKTTLEVELRKQKQANEKMLADLEDANKTLRKKLEDYQRQVEEQQEKILRAIEASDDQERVKRTLREENRSLEGRLKAMQNEFGLNTETTEYYKIKFSEICNGIGKISAKYFRHLYAETNNATISKTLHSHEYEFTPIPISESEISQQLRIAWAHYFISAYFCKAIWQPFAAENTFLNPELLSLLDRMAGTLAEHQYSKSDGRRSSRVWSALTMRALHGSINTSRLAERPSLQRYISQYSIKVVDKGFPSLTALVAPSQAGNFRKDLLALIESAISVWCSAQTNELDILIHSNLYQATYTEWQSSIGNITSSLPEGDSLGHDKKPSSRTAAYTMFPRIVAKTVQLQDQPLELLPGSWPDSYQEKKTLETCIHSGIGLSESSELIMRGKQELEETKIRLDQEHIREEMLKLEKRNRELEEKSGRIGKHSRSSSTVEAGPPSPVASWMKEGVKQVVENA